MLAKTGKFVKLFLITKGFYIMKRSDVIRTIQVQFKHMRMADAAGGDRIEIRGFGTFQPRRRAPKMGYNPSTGRPQAVAANTTVLFKPSRELTKKMNG